MVNIMKNYAVYALDNKSVIQLHYTITTNVLQQRNFQATLGLSEQEVIG